MSDAQGQSRRTILLVDDERSVRAAFAAMLEEAGYEVSAAPGGAKAVALCRERRFDVVLLDVMMPAMNGYETLRQIRVVSPFVPVVFLTALDAEETEAAALGLGADDFVRKTSSPGVILARVAAAVRRGAPPKSSFAFGTGVVDLSSLMYSRHGADDVRLSEREVAIMQTFVATPGEVISSDRLLTRFWGAGFSGSDAVLRMAIARLKAKLGPDGRFIRNVYRSGYAYDVAGAGDAEGTE